MARTVEQAAQNARDIGLMLVVADGMGGQSHAALASATAVQAMLRLYNRGRPTHSASP